MMFRPAHVALSAFLVLMAFPCGRADAQTQDTGTWWKLGGPLGGLGYNVVARPDDPQTLFVTDAWSGVQRSTDGGANWQATNTGITARAGASRDAVPVFSLALDPSNPATVWVGTQNGDGLFRSTNGGAGWTRRDAGIDFFPIPGDNDFGRTIRHITVHPGDASIVYVTGETPTGTPGTEFERVGGFVYKSVNGGESFVLSGTFASLARWLFIDPSQPDHLLLTTGIFDRDADTEDPGDTLASGPGLGVFRSTDGGATWFPSNTGMTAGRSLFVGGAARHPVDPKVFIVATGNNADAERRNAHGAVYKSTDGGANWSEITPPLPADVTYEVYSAAAFSPSDPQVVYVGTSETVYRSADQGASWMAHRGAGGTPWGPPGVRSGFPIDMFVAADDPNTLYINNYGGGLFKSVDGGQSWMAWSNGYTGADIRAISPVPATGSDRIAVNGRSGPFRFSTTPGWEGLSFGSAAWFPEGSAIAHDPSDASGQVLLLADARSGSMQRSTNGGASWDLRFAFSDSALWDSLPGRHGIRALAFARSEPSIVYAGFMADGLQTPHGMDYPASFGLYRSTDGGLSWAPRNTGLPAGPRARNVTALAVSRQNSGKVYAALRDGGLYKTTNGGMSWQAATGALPPGQAWDDVWAAHDPVPRHSILAVAVHPEDDETVVIGTNLFGVYRSADGGANWEHVLPPEAMIPNGASDHAQVMAVAYDPANGARLYTADWHGGLYLSTDGGTTWRQANEGLTNRALNNLAVSEDGVYVYGATQGEGVFRYKAREPSTTAVRPTRVAKTTMGLGINSPNPFRTVTRIPFILTEPGEARVEVFDAAGKRVAMPVRGRRDAGLHHAVFDATGLPAGSYWYRLTSGGRSFSRMMTVIR